MSALEEYEKWTESQRPIWEKDYIPIVPVHYADAMRDELLERIEKEHEWKKLWADAQNRAADYKQRADEAEADYQHEHDEADRVVGELRERLMQAEAEVERLRWMLDACYADWVDGESKEEWLADLAERYGELPF